MRVYSSLQLLLPLLAGSASMAFGALIEDYPVVNSPVGTGQIRSLLVVLN